MKIIIVNYRYFISGGPERYLFNIKELLEKNGHTVIPFSIKNQNNVPSDYEQYFMEPVSKAEEVYFSEYNKANLATALKSISRMFYSLEAKKKLSRLIKVVRPDIIYVLHYQNKISASIFDAARKNKVPVVHRISDFGQICSNAHFYRPKQEDICERCLKGSKWNAVVNKCVHDSYVYSAIKAGSVKFQQMAHITSKIQSFVVPSKFTMEKLESYGFPKSKLMHVPTFFNTRSLAPDTKIKYGSFGLYIGRIEPEKGLMTLVKAFEDTKFNLKIIGFSVSGYDNELKKYLENKRHNIEFLGRKTFDEIQAYLCECAFTVVPSELYDNFPNTILESFAFSKCVIATGIGSLKELVADNKTGLLFKIKDYRELREKITYLFNNTTECQRMGSKALDTLKNEYAEEGHYNKLMKIFSSAIQAYQTRNISLQPT